MRSCRSAYSSSTRLRSRPGEGAEAQVENRRRLDLGERELRHQLLARGVGVVGAADHPDHLVEVVEGDQIAGEDVCAVLGLAQVVLRAARDDHALEVDVVRDQLEQRERLRHVVDERNGVVAERRLQPGVLVELVQHDLRDRIALELDLNAHAGAVRVVREVGDLGDHLVLDEVGDLLDHARLAALLGAVGQLGDDDRGLAAAQLLDVGARAHHDAAAARAVGVADSLPADDDRAGREVGALDVLGQVVHIRGRLVDQLHDRIDDLAQTVHRHVRCHADGDAGRAVDEQVREA